MAYRIYTQTCNENYVMDMLKRFGEIASFGALILVTKDDNGYC